MQTVPQIRPISDMSQRQGEVMPLLDNGPVILAARSKPTAVMVSVDTWDKMILRIEELEDSVEVWRGLYEVETGRDTIETADIKELERMAGRVPA